MNEGNCMYIDTHTKSSMENSVLNVFSITSQDLEKLFYKLKFFLQTEHNSNMFDEMINDFINTKSQTNNLIDEILFFHLGRRLNSASDSNIGNNLFDLLTTENEFSLFLKNYDISFISCNGHIDLIHKSCILNIDNYSDETLSLYLKRRLGHFEEYDYCINGFAFKDTLYHNSYANELYYGPEIITNLDGFFNEYDILNDYFNNSTYYCFEYKVPLDKVVFDEKSDLSRKEKTNYLLNKVIYKLFEYYITDVEYISDESNPILRLDDNETMCNEFYLTKEKINYDMLY